MVVMSSEN